MFSKSSAIESWVFLKSYFLLLAPMKQPVCEITWQPIRHGVHLCIAWWQRWGFAPAAQENFTVLENSWICFECISSYFVFYLKYLFNDLIYWNFNANRFMFYLQRAGVIRQELAKLKKQAAAWDLSFFYRLVLFVTGDCYFHLFISFVYCYLVFLLSHMLNRWVIFWGAS